MLKQLKNKNEGFVFLAVLIISLVSTVLVLSAMSLNVSQVMLTEDEVKRIQAGSIATGAMTVVIANQQSASPGTPINWIEALNGTDFDVQASVTAGTGIDGTDSVVVDVSW